MIRLEPTQLADAAAAIRRGQVVAYPTETYYGLAVDVLDPLALERLFALKGREAEKTSALLVADLTAFGALCEAVPARAQELAARYWPGPLTMALPARPNLPAAIVSQGFVAARVSSHPVAHALVLAAGRAITATSANPSGKPPVSSAGEVAAYFGDAALWVLDDGATPGGAPSTLVRLVGNRVEILRQGAVVL
jgi:L-threonylcarbamoyladenylate synthase